MNVSPRSVWIPLVVIACCSSVVSRRGLAAEPVAASVQDPQAQVAPVSVVAPRWTRRHPQVNQSRLGRNYRSLPMHGFRTADERIREALAQEVPRDPWEFVETPLRAVVTQVSDRLKFPVAIDMRALEDAGIDCDAPITFRAESTSVRSRLRSMLDDINLTWLVRDERLLITTKEKAAESLVTRLYPLPFGYGIDSNPVDFQSLVDVLQSTVQPQSWDVQGGPGSIRPMEDPQGLFVSQTEATHHDVEGVMQALHAQGCRGYGLAEDGSAPAAPIVRIHEVADARIRADLAATLVALCNDSLAKGADAQARVTALGECLAVQSVSPEFHVLAAQLIRGVAGIEVSEQAVPGNPGGAVTFGTGR